MNLENSPPGKPVKILVVEDSPTQAEYLRGLLELQGYEVGLVGNGREALAAMRMRKPDIVISDILMPEMDGYQMCREMRRTPEFHNTPVMVLTSLSDPRDVIRGISSGVDYYLTKPFEESFLLKKVQFIHRAVDGEISDLDQEELAKVLGDILENISTAGPRLLSLLLSTYENAVEQNRALQETKRELEEKNTYLKEEIVNHAAAEDKLKEQGVEQRKMVNLMAGREMRMAELRGVIQQLHKQIKAAGLTPLDGDVTSAGNMESEG